MSSGWRQVAGMLVLSTPHFRLQDPKLIDFSHAALISGDEALLWRMSFVRSPRVSCLRRR